MNFREVWDHQLRWARTIRVCQGGPFFLSVLSNASFWPVLWLVAVPSTQSVFGSALILGTRMAAGYYFERKLTGSGKFTSCWVAVAKDFLQLGIWFRAFTGKNVTWRGVGRKELQRRVAGDVDRELFQRRVTARGNAK